MLMKELYNMQKDLDEFIRKSKGITKDEIELLGDVCLATLVEVGEFAEEIEHEKALYEYVDALHFLLRINNILELDYMILFEFEDMYKTSKFDLETNRDKETMDFIAKLTNFINNTRCFKYWSKEGPKDKLSLMDNYAESMFHFLALGNYMGFTAKDIIEAYKIKREKNFRRQEENY